MSVHSKLEKILGSFKKQRDQLVRLQREAAAGELAHRKQAQEEEALALALAGVSVRIDMAVCELNRILGEEDGNRK